jgi:hypothetical protein
MGWSVQFAQYSTHGVFTQLLYEIAHAAMADELGEDQFKNLLATRALDLALPQACSR